MDLTAQGHIRMKKLCHNQMHILKTKKIDRERNVKSQREGGNGGEIEIGRRTRGGRDDEV